MSSTVASGHIRKTSIRAPKVGHKKSRKGCQTCKTRRVKCDEVTPECGSCLRLGLECTYAPVEASQRTRQKSQPADGSVREAKRSPVGSASQDSPPPATGDTLSDEPYATQPVQDPSSEETEFRRYTELRLMHHWMVHVSRPFGMTAPPAWRELWYAEIPQIGLSHKNVLYSLYSMTATHMIGRGTNDTALYQARENYWVWALREQRAAISDLDNSDTDAVAFAAVLITANSLAMLQERSLDPYSPPMDWLEVGRGAFAVLPAPETVSEGTAIKVLIETTAPIWQATLKFDSDMQKEFGAVLTRDISSADVWDPDTTESYETALSYIGSFRRAIIAGEPADISLRWICMFPFMVPRQFVDFVGEGRPRALVILAYFFAVVAHTDALQYLGNSADHTTAKREIYAIRRVLPEEWLSLMTWPLNEIATLSTG